VRRFGYFLPGTPTVERLIIEPGSGRRDGAVIAASIKRHFLLAGGRMRAGIHARFDPGFLKPLRQLEIFRGSYVVREKKR
jgi:hypothetical protein